MDHLANHHYEISLLMLIADHDEKDVDDGEKKTILVIFIQNTRIRDS